MISQMALHNGEEGGEKYPSCKKWPNRPLYNYYYMGHF